MARIRTVKPELFRHEGLQDLETAHPGNHCILTFIGLFGHCDKAGRFEWKPRTLKLDILPFLEFDIAKTLQILASAKFVRQYEVAGKVYGVIDSFAEHQRVGGKEAQEPAKYPEPPMNERGSIGEAPEKTNTEEGIQTGEATVKHSELQEGKGREGKGSARRAPTKTSLPENFTISDRVKKWAEGKGCLHLEARLEDFVSKALAKGYTYADWDEGFMGAIRNDWAKLNGKAAQNLVPSFRKTGTRWEQLDPVRGWFPVLETEVPENLRGVA